MNFLRSSTKRTGGGTEVQASSKLTFKVNNVNGSWLDVGCLKAAHPPVYSCENIFLRDEA
ncbi:hypothetical protein RJ640_027049 [Escallonia rubra]|uniref:Uncharacterized protein n=1 Tax=Escallonia rubra TaxID=112253 RepID=A0AA88RQI6_9ASTE|nr:hypothetical protein RJ640_027049 [Escallonia rubra]